ncbi:stalk domain-containing protein [Anoxynatronum buryatiense]|uniref:Copper amine oxidase-like N-terminal domain-containing protein n=1 Tax=Anoxynatronum buryatiense TaxID=489973 RepID=A0AA46AHC8_9CLOT|nr:stalk domain-containing protein [Anoxynatronum buryatiense]SMP38732.1 hypothetical protein SAMN06296020_101141 [Anoxynatronum buryatiense]
MKETMKAVRFFIAGMLMMALLSSVVVMASPVVKEMISGVRVEVDGNAVNFSADSEPFIIEGRTFLPLRALAETLGLAVDYRYETNTVLVTTEGLSAENAVKPITEAEIAAAQAAWGKGLVDISTAYATGDDYVAVAQVVMDSLYGYDDGTVLFKPTLSQNPYTFRFTEEGATTYFIGTERAQDGFALKPWTVVEFDTNGKSIINGEIALWMGNVHITNDKGEVTTVDKTFGYYRNADGDVRINVHHSSLPVTN